MRELLALSNSRDILGCRKHPAGDDLNAVYRHAAKRVAPESGGTGGLLRADNPARHVLKVHEF
jgi:hypothetical protein